MKALLDRFEGDWAIFEVKGKERRVRRSRLPEGVREGQVLDLSTLRHDRAASEKARDRVKQAIARLEKKKAPPGDFEL